MDEQTKVTLAAAVVGGYVLGRTKKGRLALTVGTYLAGRRFGLGPRQLAAEGMRRLGEIPEVAQVRDQMRGEVLDAGRQAVTAAADRGMNSLAGAIGDRTARLREARDEFDEPDDEYEEPGEGDEEPGEGDEEDEGPARRKAPAASQWKSTGTTAVRKAAAKETPAKKAVPARKKAAKSAASPKESADRSAARSKKTAARKTASPTRAASGRPDRRR